MLDAIFSDSNLKRIFIILYLPALIPIDSFPTGSIVITDVFSADNFGLSMGLETTALYGAFFLVLLLLYKADKVIQRPSNRKERILIVLIDSSLTDVSAFCL